MNPQKEAVGLDSQCLSYLIDAIAGISEPTDSFAEEKKALLRSWFYTSGTFILTETVVSEINRIRNKDRRELHEGFMDTLFLSYPTKNQIFIREKSAQFELIHPEPNDCRILAEAEELNLKFLLTYDHDFWKKLSQASTTTTLIKPSTYWSYLNIPKGAKPITVPHPTNPLKDWWRWE